MSASNETRQEGKNVQYDLNHLKHADQEGTGTINIKAKTDQNGTAM